MDALTLNWTVENLTDQAPGIISQAPPLCLQEFIVGQALRYSIYAFVLALFAIIYFGRLRKPLLKFLWKRLDYEGAQTWIKVVDKVLLILIAGFVGACVQALWTVQG